ncbi:MAG: hypothetical protein LIQ31_10195, partial [Planctomycetes bacterium]|nr:hypothetical protein [Planctomycetota bacterium]
MYNAASFANGLTLDGGAIQALDNYSYLTAAAGKQLTIGASDNSRILLTSELTYSSNPIDLGVRIDMPIVFTANSGTLTADYSLQYDNPGVLEIWADSLVMDGGEFYINEDIDLVIDKGITVNSGAKLFSQALYVGEDLVVNSGGVIGTRDRALNQARFSANGSILFKSGSSLMIGTAGAAGDRLGQVALGTNASFEQGFKVALSIEAEDVARATEVGDLTAASPKVVDELASGLGDTLTNLVHETVAGKYNFAYDDTIAGGAIYYTGFGESGEDPDPGPGPGPG